MFFLGRGTDAHRASEVAAGLPSLPARTSGELLRACAGKLLGRNGTNREIPVDRAETDR
ncbi:hypothetical protein Sya03_21680 [Spirilliplanes yamanashiensis]|uniref:Uncharacterized protein n=1 Tax=Spirilliplanes yamanashiensis TaxID=42233 RepID=A0A8J4DIJ3_9ACTN|nr:hypothetical protein Sya03_21680 [Spirilliplanes yamanashiensis]